MAKSNKYAQAKGRETRKKAQRLILLHNMLKHKKFRSLSGSAVKVLLEICTRHTGFNNRKIACSYSQLAKPLGIGKATVKKALDELIEKGFLEIVVKGYYTGRRATEWEITFLPSEGYEPTNMWKDPDQRPNRPNLNSLKLDSVQEVIMHAEKNRK